MNREIAIAHVEPDGLAKISHRLQAIKGITLHAPASLFAEKAGENVGNGIEVRGHVKPPPDQVIAGVYD